MCNFNSVCVFVCVEVMRCEVLKGALTKNTKQTGHEAQATGTESDDR